MQIIASLTADQQDRNSDNKVYTRKTNYLIELSECRYYQSYAKLINAVIRFSRRS